MPAKAIALLSCCIMGAAGPVLAEGGSESAGEILTACQAAVNQSDGVDVAPERAAPMIWCIGYVSGIVDGHTLGTQLNKAPPLYCLPERGASTDQLIRVVVKYLRERPEILHESGRIHVMMALRGAFPCKR